MSKKVKRELKHIRHQIKDDIEVYFRCRDSGGYFAVPQLVLTLVDYLGALNSGKGRSSSSKDAVDFIRSYFPAQYHWKAGLVYHALRHGTVHERRPKRIEILRIGNLYWFLEKDDKSKKEHLIPSKLKIGKIEIKALTIVLPELVSDLKIALDRFEEKLKKDPNLRRNFLSCLRDFLKGESEKDLVKRKYLDPLEFSALRQHFRRRT